MSELRHLLIVDDDPEIRGLLHDFLVAQGFRVSTAADGLAMNRALAQWTVDLIVLDVNLPGEDGTSLCRRLRAHSTVPIIMLTAMASDVDRIVGLEVGADDYIVKPFNARELLARIRAVLRRSPRQHARARPKRLRFAGLTLDQGRRELRTADDVVVHLSSGEYALLSVFLEQPQQVIAREALIERLRGESAAPFDRSIDIQVSRLRRKLEDAARAPAPITTVRGVGYHFAAAVEEIAPEPADGSA